MLDVGGMVMSGLKIMLSSLTFTFDVVDISLLLVSNKTPFLTWVCDPTHSNHLFDSFSYNNQIREALCRTSNQVFKVWCFKSIGEQTYDFLLQ